MDDFLTCLGVSDVTKLAGELAIHGIQQPDDLLQLDYVEKMELVDLLKTGGISLGDRAKINHIIEASRTSKGSESDAPSSKRVKHESYDSSKRVKHESYDFHLQPPLTTVGDFVEIHHKIQAGFSVDKCRVFVRPESVALWTAMESAVNNCKNLRVSGPPGTGKSTEAWAWALWKAQETKTKVVWFHFSKNHSTKVVIDGVLMQITTGHSAEIADIKSSDGDYLVVDGVTKLESVAISRACYAWRKHVDRRTFVTVSSVSIPVAVQEDEEAKIISHAVPSWTLAQYQQACEDKPFFNSVKDNLQIGDIPDDDLVLAKYAFAGGSVRWMFEFDMGLFNVDFKVHFDKVNSYKDIFRENGGDSSPDAVNHLRGLTITSAGEQNYFFISQYAARRLYEHCITLNDERQFIIDGYKQAIKAGNPSFRGWIFEFDVDYQLKQAFKKSSSLEVMIHPVDDAEQKKEKWDVDAYVTFQSRDELLFKLKSLANNEYLWAKPELWCQKSFDFLRFHRCDGQLVMVAVNATIAKKHSVLLSVLSDLGKFLATKKCPISSILFRFVVPSGEPPGEPFAVGNVTGELDDWQWPPSKMHMLDGGHISVADLPCTS